MIKYRLFLDDTRNPSDCYSYTKNKIYFEDWSVVRNYNEFINCVEVFGVPSIISFDNDLSDVKNDPKHIERTGYDCAKWLCEYCLDNKLIFPFYLIHSGNPVGKENIDIYIKNYQKHCENGISK